MPSKAMSIKNVYDKKYKTFPFDGVWQMVFGEPETSGLWLVFGPEKHGKTWFAIMLANYLSQFDRVLYVSAEEGVGKAFGETCLRAGLPANKRGLSVIEYEPIEELAQRLKKPRSPRIVILDNLTIYNDELKNGGLRGLQKSNKHVLFICLAHEERKEPYTATAKLCRKLSNIIIHVEGLACQVSGRVPGGWLTIDEERAMIYHGKAITENQYNEVATETI